MKQRNVFIVAALMLAVASLAGCADRGGKGADQAGEYRVLIFSLEDEWKMVRYNVRTGATWHSVGQAWQQFREEGQVAASAYDVVVTQRPGGWNVARIDTATGLTWYAKGDAWVAMREE
jgi:hypothetical protein